MPSLLRHPLARLITVTAAIGSLADWVLFATLVVTVDRLIGGGPWATAIVLLVRILPGVVFAPLAARRTDGADLRTTLVRHEVLRVGAVVTLAAAFATTLVPLVLVALLALEFAAAMQAAARESTISRHVPRRLFTGLNTATAVLTFGLLPVGPVVVDLVGATSGWILAIAAYAALALTYGLLLRLEDAPAVRADPAATAPVAPGATPSSAPVATSWVRVTLAAALGILPAVALFTLGPSFAHAWVGDRSATGPLYAAVLAGGAAGFALANRTGFRADVAMAVASGGLVLAATGWWVPGLVLLGLGAGGAYLDLQTRLQHAATDPSQFAASFALLKVATGAAVAGAPALASVAPLPVVLVVGAVTAATGSLVTASTPAVLLQRLVRALLAGLIGRVVRVEVVGAHRRVDGPAVIVSNHPHWLDGAVALLADRQLRPIARRQRHPVARLGIWAAGAVVTAPPRPAFAEAAAHLRAGGRIWLAPEGGAHAGRRLQAPRSGAVRMAHLASTPIQPLAIGWHDDPAGPHLHRWRPWRRRVVRLTWGEPVHTTGDVAHDNARMMAALAAVTGMQPPAPAPVAA